MSSARPRIRRSAPAGRRARFALAGPAALLAAALTACSGGASGSAEAGGDGKAPDTSITVNLRGEAAAPGEPVKVTLAHGKLKSVSVKPGEGGPLAGKISADGRTWTSDRVAAPGTAYTVEATDADGGSDRATFATAESRQGQQAVARAGQEHDRGHRAAAVRRLRPSGEEQGGGGEGPEGVHSNDTEGSWGWLQDYSGKDRVDWRPKEYWKPGTKVTLDARLNGVDTGADGGWFVRDYATMFTIGAAQVVKVDLDGHRLSLHRDGKQVADLPMSAGTPVARSASGGARRS